MGIKILPPDVNQSDHEFVVVDGNIRFGLDAVKGVGYQAVEAIKARAATTDAVAVGGTFTVHEPVRVLRARRQPRGQQEGDRGADQMRRVRLHRRDSRKGMLSVLEQAQAAGAEVAAGHADRAGIDLRSGDAR